MLKFIKIKNLCYK